MKGYWISIEGGEGAGKSVQIQRLKEYLERLGHGVIATREPGGIKLAEDIRFLLLNKDVKEMDVFTEMLLYCAARREHFIRVIQPALQKGKIVICDRFVDSSLVYQGIVKGIGWEAVYRTNMQAIQDVLPNLTLYFDVDPSVGLSRIQQNPDREQNRFDLAPLKFHQQVRAGYQKIAQLFPERIVTIDATPSIEEVFSNVKEIVKNML